MVAAGRSARPPGAGHREATAAPPPPAGERAADRPRRRSGPVFPEAGRGPITRWVRPAATAGEEERAAGCPRPSPPRHGTGRGSSVCGAPTGPSRGMSPARVGGSGNRAAPTALRPGQGACRPPTVTARPAGVTPRARRGARSRGPASGTSSVAESVPAPCTTARPRAISRRFGEAGRIPTQGVPMGTKDAIGFRDGVHAARPVAAGPRPDRAAVPPRPPTRSCSSAAPPGNGRCAGHADIPREQRDGAVGRRPRRLLQSSTKRNT